MKFGDQSEFINLGLIHISGINGDWMFMFPYPPRLYVEVLLLHGIVLEGGPPGGDQACGWSLTGGISGFKGEAES